MEELTAEEMDREAEQIAEAFFGIVDAGTDSSSGVEVRIGLLLSLGLRAFGSVNQGLDKEAHKGRLFTKVGAKFTDLVAERFFPLTESE